MTTEILDSYPRSATRPVVGECTFTDEDAARLRVLLHWSGKGAAAPVQQVCCCTSTPGRPPAVGAWKGGVLYGGFRSSLQAGFRPVAFECCVSAWGSTSLAASYALALAVVGALCALV